ncbi:hypothetical protein TWF694_004846 [Orbilia ellipsospora]|uniref:CsbD-like domain-containing protein n=1 Tax=Orbilia ellipsospora TaxID=2528407 RepID=A0AAV9WZU7_9PEZI
MAENPNQSSTLGSMLQGMAGTVQSTLGQLTGNQKDIQEGEIRRSNAEESNERSHTAAKLGPVTATAEGGTHVDHEDRQKGSWDQTIGSGKQFVGGLIGSESLKAQGRAQYDDGVRLETSGQASDLSQGVVNRVVGTLGAMTSTDSEEREKYNRQHDEGKAAVRSVQHDLQKQSEALEKNS